MPRLSVDNIVRVVLNLAPGSASGNIGCNIGLILGSSTAISAATRMKQYSSATEMLGDGFTTSSPEYLAAEKYFAQSPAPRSVYVGRINGAASPAETPVDALLACVDMTSDFYGVYLAGATDAQIASLAAQVDTLGRLCLFFETANTDALVENPSTADIFTTLAHDAGYLRCL